MLHIKLSLRSVTSKEVYQDASKLLGKLIQQEVKSATIYKLLRLQATKLPSITMTSLRATANSYEPTSEDNHRIAATKCTTTNVSTQVLFTFFNSCMT